jgi:uncharacterized SAM-dependent methyltransferase
MLTRNKNNFQKWFGKNIKTRYICRDILREGFGDITLAHTNDGGAEGNLILLLGGTSHAFHRPSVAYMNIRQSMTTKDIFMVSTKLDSDMSRRYFDFNPTYNPKLLPTKELFLVHLLNLDETIYDVEQFYDDVQRQRVIQIRLKFDVTLVFQLENGIKSIDFKRGEAIMLWRFWHQTMEELQQELSDCGFNVMQAVKSPDEQYAMVVAKVRTDKVNHR